MKRSLIIGAGLLALTAFPAAAADIAVKAPRVAPIMAPAFSWTGCYLGGYVGGAFAGRDVTVRDINGYNYGGVAGPPFGYNLDASVIGGGTLGCNIQTGQWVFGVEGEGGYMSLRGSRFDPNSAFLPLDTISSTRIGDWYGMITGRAGVAFDRTLLYVKGGAAFVDHEVTTVDALLAGGNTITAVGGKTKFAWTVGGGIEYAFASNWTIKGEYMYLGLKHTENACGVATIGGGVFCWSHDVPGVHTAKIGLNYLFNAGGPVVARY